MGKGRARWATKALRQRFPLPRERQSRPRCDGVYKAPEHEIQAEFAADGTLTFQAEEGRWHVEDGVLHVRTRQWHCEGPIEVEELYLLCSYEGDDSRLELEMAFSPS